MVAPWLRITLFFQFSLPSKFCIAKYVMLRVVIWFTRLSDTVSGPHLLSLYNISCVKYQNHQRPDNVCCINFWYMYSVFRLNFIGKKVNFNARLASSESLTNNLVRISDRPLPINMGQYGSN